MISSHEIPNEVLYESFTHVQEMSSDHLYFKILLKENFNKILQIIKEFKIPRREGAAHPPLFTKAAQNVKQGGHSFLNSLNSLNGYWIFLVLELFLKKPYFGCCSWNVLEKSLLSEMLTRFIVLYNGHHLIRSPTFEYLTIFGWNL